MTSLDYEPDHAHILKQERKRIAKMLHDTVNQSLFGASSIASSLPPLLQKEPALADKFMSDLDQLLREASESLHEILDELNRE